MRLVYKKPIFLDCIDVINGNNNSLDHINTFYYREFTNMLYIMEEKLLVLADFEGIAQGGYFIRNDLFKFIKRLENDGKTVIGIKLETDIIVEVLIKVE